MRTRDLSSLIKRTGNILASFPRIQSAYLYGSCLRSKQFRDIDVALGLARRRTPEADSIGLRIRIAQALRCGTHALEEFDVHLLHEMPLSLQYRVIATGRCIFSRDAKEKIRYETWLLNQFLDFKPTHDWLIDQTLHRAERQP